MLIEFSVENYLSFHERVTLSMEAAPELDASDGLLENTFEAPGGVRLLKSALIYGANASGKSNLVKAFNFARLFVNDSASGAKILDPIDVTPFKLLPSTAGGGSQFEFVWFDGRDRFRYRFTVNAARVLEEELFVGTPETDDEVALFQRKLDHIEVNHRFEAGPDLVSRTRENSLFLSVAAQFNVAQADRAARWFWGRRAVSGLDDRKLLKFTIDSLKRGEWYPEILRLARRADLGITRVATSGDTLKIRHRSSDERGQPAEDVVFDLSEESEGTQKFIALAGPLLEVIKGSMTLFIDEFDARLHPRLARAVVKLFHGDGNPGNAQLIAATHDTNLLDRRLLRRDQIWFTEKDDGGATELYSLADFDLPAGAVYERDYLIGKYGAVPAMGRLVMPPEQP